MATTQSTRKPNDGLKNAAKRAKQRIEALQSVLARVNRRIDRLTAPSGVTAPLTGKINALEKALTEKRAADKDLGEEIKLLKNEISKLVKAT